MSRAATETHASNSSDPTADPTAAPSAGFRYAAMISYRHAEPDRTWAMWLHKALETYRVPRAIARRTGRARIGRLFRDEEELAASSDLSREIDEALQQSEFLIVICSPRAPGSQWVNREIERFRELGRGDRILAVLVEGEPAESFPRALVEIRRHVTDASGMTGEQIEAVEPLAADVRDIDSGGDGHLAGRHARRHALLRIAACLLGVRFDDLRRRERLRRQRRMIALAAVCVIALAAVVAALSVHVAQLRQEQSRTVSQWKQAERRLAEQFVAQQQFPEAVATLGKLLQSPGERDGEAELLFRFWTPRLEPLSKHAQSASTGTTTARSQPELVTWRGGNFLLARDGPIRHVTNADVSVYAIDADQRYLLTVEDEQRTVVRDLTTLQPLLNVDVSDVWIRDVSDRPTGGGFVVAATRRANSAGEETPVTFEIDAAGRTVRATAGETASTPRRIDNAPAAFVHPRVLPESAMWRVESPGPTTNAGADDCDEAQRTLDEIRRILPAALAQLPNTRVRGVLSDAMKEPTSLNHWQILRDGGVTLVVYEDIAAQSLNYYGIAIAAEGRAHAIDEVHKDGDADGLRGLQSGMAVFETWNLFASPFAVLDLQTDKSLEINRWPNPVVSAAYQHLDVQVSHAARYVAVTGPGASGTWVYDVDRAGGKLNFRSQIKPPRPETSTTAICWINPHGRPLLLIGSSRGDLSCWDPERTTTLWSSATLLTADVRTIRADNSGAIATAASGREIRLFSTLTGNPLSSPYELPHEPASRATNDDDRPTPPDVRVADDGSVRCTIADRVYIRSVPAQSGKIPDLLSSIETRTAISAADGVTPLTAAALAPANPGAVVSLPATRPAGADGRESP